MGKTDILNIQNFKKWILPILMFVFCEFIFKRKILPIFRKFVLTGDYFFDGIFSFDASCDGIYDEYSAGSLHNGGWRFFS